MVAISEAALINQLERRGIRYLRGPAGAKSPTLIAPATMIAALASQAKPRFWEALVVWFLRRPQDSGLVPAGVAQLSRPAALALKHAYTVAVYLQRFWQDSLSLYLGQFPLMPDYFGQAEFHLPAPELYFGEAGLRQLAALFEEETGCEWWSLYQSIIDLFLKQLSLDAEHETGQD